MAKKEPVPAQDSAAADSQEPAVAQTHAPPPSAVSPAAGDPAACGTGADSGAVTTAEQAAALVGIEPDQVFAFHDHGAFVRVVTVDGRKLYGAK